ncbi:MAG: hypothetical protein JSR39_00445 [Verrucomicrobia bacterium]|nr:hypothetical protein [Verrucomicrobiota bacterium]
MSYVICESPQVAINLETPLSFEAAQVRNENLRVIDGLKAEFGSEVANEVWNKIKLEFRESCLNGTKSLTPYGENLNEQGHNILLEKVKAGNVEIIQQSPLPVSAIDEFLEQCDNSALKSYIEHPQSFSQAIQLEIAARNRIAQANAQLLVHLKNAYSTKVVDEVYNLIPESNRELLAQGKLSLSQYLPGIKKRCEALYQYTSAIGTLPQGEELQAFLRTAKVSKYVGASQGAFFIEGTHKEQPFTLVAKAAEKPAQEYFANTLYPKLHIPTPTTLAMGASRDKETALILKKVLERSTEFKEKYPKECPKMFLVMSCVPGCTLEDWKAADILEAEAQEPSAAIYDQVLFDIGQIAGADFLLYYRDRLPTIGIGNLANLMILKDANSKCVGAVAIDQVAYLSQDFKKYDLMQIDPLERIQEIVTTMMENPDEISAEARAIFKDALPESVKEHLDEQRALKAIQKGMMAGLSKVAILGTPELLKEVHQQLPKASNARDKVDLDMHKAMLGKIQGAVLTS